MNVNRKLRNLRNFERIIESIMNLKSEIAGFAFSNPLMNASGAKCRLKDELEELLNGNNAAYVTKSATLKEREGNPKPRYYDVPLGSINSMGLPNQGLDFYLEYVTQNASTKTAFLSIAGLSKEENISLLQKVQSSEFQGLVELNLSCPNVPGKPQTAYDFEQTQILLEQVFESYHKPLGVKLPPYFDMVHFEMMASILNQFPLSFVTCINSIGNALYIEVETESVVIKPKHGFGGIGGAYVKPTALANVRKFYTLLKSSISLVGCGGVETGRDVFEHILCGASMVQVGTQLMKEGVSVFERLERELQFLMEEKGYTSLDQFRGKLQDL